jgi:hypothetical protein
VTDIVPDASNHQRKNVHRTHQLRHSALLNSPVPPPLATTFAEVRVVVVFAEEVERRRETHANEEGVARLSDIGGVVEVVVAVASVVGGSEGEEERLEALCEVGKEVKLVSLRKGVG